MVDKDAEPDDIVTEFNKVVTEKATKRLRKQRQKEKNLITDEILDCFDQNRDLQNKRGPPRGG